LGVNALGVDKGKDISQGRTSMPKALPSTVRRAVFRRWNRHQSARAIAEELSLALSTVKGLLKRFEHEGEKSH
jgi:transposase